MAKYASLVEETTATTGTSDLVLTGATTGHRTLAAAFSADDYVNYLIRDADGTTFERGYGQFNGTTGLTRQYVVESSNSDAKVTLSAGIHTVTISAHPGMAQWQGFHIWRSTNLALPSNTETDVSFDSVLRDTENIISTPVTDIPVPEWVDLCRVTGYFEFASNTQYKYIQIESHTGIPIDPDGNRREQYDGQSRILMVSAVFPGYNHADFGFKVRALAVTAMDLYAGAWIECEFIQ